MPRQRMVVEDPVSGEAQLGLGIYYLDVTGGKAPTYLLTGPPSNTMGVPGDLTVIF
jgi:hypothetical protein